jgi:hypothetical protein
MKPTSEEIIEQAWREGVLRATEKRTGIGDVIEGSLAQSLAYVFRQIEENGIGRRSEG